MSDEYNVKLLVKQTKLNAKNALSHNEKYSGFKDLLKDNIPESLVDYNGNAYDISSVFHDTNWSSTNSSKTPSTNSSQSNQKFSQIETNANLELYKNAKLVPHEDASGTTHKLWTVYDNASNNLLEHMINYKFDNSGSYLPILTYHNGSSYVESTMFSDPLWWLIDYENHAISFFNTDSALNGGTVNISASSDNPPKLTFYRYIGKTKVNNKLSVEGDISCNEVIVSGTTLTSKLGIIDASYSDLSGVVTANIGNIASNTNNKAPINNPTFNGTVTCNSGLNVSQGSSSDSPIVFDNNFPKPAINKQTSGLNFFHYLDGSPTRNYDLFIKSDTGNVGIGTSDPKCLLNTNNLMTSSDNTIPNLSSGINGNNSVSLFLGKSHSSNINYWGMWMGTIYKTGYPSYIQCGDSSTQFNLLLNPEGGNVGIGTDEPGAKLEVKGNLVNNACINIKSQTSTNQSYELKIRDDTTNYPLHIGPGTAFDGINISNNGNVGIGTTSTGSKLHVNGDINCLATDYGDITPNNGYIARYDSTRLTHLHYFGMDTWGNKMYLNWYSQNDIITNGNVGIGTSSPGAKLEINGNVKMKTNNFIKSYNLVQHNQASSNIGNTLLVSRATFGNYNVSGTNYHPNGFAFNTRAVHFNCDVSIGGDEDTYTAAPIALHDNGKITTTGHVGIGTTSPVYPLHVTSFITRNPTVESDFGASNSNYYRFYQNTNVGQIGSTTTVACSVFAHGYYIGEGLLNNSDIRIKENIRDVSDNDALQKLRDISCVYYEYKDKINRGTDTTIGFIAQQVKEHMPIAVSLQKDIIPNEMRILADYSWNQIADASGNYDLSNNQYKLTIHDLSDNSGNSLYCFYVSNDPSGNDEIKKEIKSLEDDPKSFVFDQSWNNVLLYGKEVDDFHTLDKHKLFALNFSATQEIDRIQQSQQQIINDQQNTINALQSTLVALEARIAALENP